MALLGCGLHEVAVFDRWESAKVADLRDVISGVYSRVLDGHSEAVVRVGHGCCSEINKIATNRHELMITRDGEQVWSGPIMQINAGQNDTVIRAFDHWIELDARFFPEDVTVSGDLSQIAVQLVELANQASYDQFLQFAQVSNVNVFGEREYEECDSIGVALRELTRGILSMTWIGRRLLIFGPEPIGGTALLQDKDFLANLRVVVDGLSLATMACVQGKEGVNQSCGGEDEFWGLWARSIKDDSIVDEKSARALACSMVQSRVPAPIALQVPDGAVLSPRAPVTIHDLVPGVQIPIWSDSTCLTVNQNMILARLQVEWDHEGEQVKVTVIPPEELGALGESGEPDG